MEAEELKSPFEAIKQTDENGKALLSTKTR